MSIQFYFKTKGRLIPSCITHLSCHEEKGSFWNKAKRVSWKGIYHTPCHTPKPTFNFTPDFKQPRPPFCKTASQVWALGSLDRLPIQAFHCLSPDITYLTAKVVITVHVCVNTRTCTSQNPVFRHTGALRWSHRKQATAAELNCIANGALQPPLNQVVFEVEDTWFVNSGIGRTRILAIHPMEGQGGTKCTCPLVVCNRRHHHRQQQQQQ